MVMLKTWLINVHQTQPSIFILCVELNRIPSFRQGWLYYCSLNNSTSQRSCFLLTKSTILNTKAAAG